MGKAALYSPNTDRSLASVCVCVCVRQGQHRVMRKCFVSGYTRLLVLEEASMTLVSDMLLAPLIRGIMELIMLRRY